MTLTKRQLQKIIKEETYRLLQEYGAEWSRTDPPPPDEPDIDEQEYIDQFGPFPYTREANQAPLSVPEISGQKGSMDFELDPEESEIGTYQIELEQHLRDTHPSLPEEDIEHFVGELSDLENESKFFMINGIRYSPQEDFLFSYKEHLAKKEAERLTKQAEERRYAKSIGVDPRGIDPRTGLDFDMDIGMLCSDGSNYYQSINGRCSEGKYLESITGLLPRHIKTFKFNEEWYFHNEGTGKVYLIPDEYKEKYGRKLSKEERNFIDKAQKIRL